MKNKLLTLFVMGIILAMGTSTALAVPSVEFRQTIAPRLDFSGVSGDQIEMRGRLCVVGGTESFTGTLHYSVWGVGFNNNKCRIACFNCYDWEACGGQYCDDACIIGAFPLGTNTKCGDLPNCPTSCGVDCSVNKDTVYTDQFTVAPGQCSQEYTFTTDIDSSWTKGWYVANLDTLWQERNLDVEYAEFQVGGIPTVNVEIIYFGVVALGALAFLFWRR